MDCQIIQHEYKLDDRALKLGVEVDLCFADPPYNIGVKYADDATGDKLPDRHYLALMRAVIRQLFWASRPGATLWWVCPEDKASMMEDLLSLYGPKLYRIVWHETFSQYNRYDLTQDYRFIYCHACAKVPPNLPPGIRNEPYDSVTKNLDAIRIPSRRMELGDKRASGPKIPGRVWQMRRLQGTSKDRINWHPAQMPPEILQRIVEGWTNPGDTVLDAFAGSGSMGVETLKLGRRFIGVDKSETYCFKMRARLGVAEP